MILMLELVSIGVFGACLSALLCMITKGTPYEVPKVISFKQGLLRPRVIRCGKWPQSKSGIVCKEKQTRQVDWQQIHASIDSRPQKLPPNVPRSYKQHFHSSVRNLEKYSQTVASKAVDNIKDYWKEDRNLPILPYAVRNDCKYCGNVERLKYTQSMIPKDKKTRMKIKKSLSRIKTALVSNKNDESCAESDDRKWTKVRTKKRRFILPKNLIIAKKPNDADAEETVKADSFEDTIDKELRSNERYCYLEALRIKINKAEKNL